MKKNLLLIVLALVSSLGFGQRSQPTRNQSVEDFGFSVSRARSFAPNGVVRCASDEYLKSKQRRGVVPSDDAFEAWLAPKIAEIKRLRQVGRLPAVIRIPVVVHVVHNGDAVGSGENIADGQVLSQITVFNQDFRRMSGTPGFNTHPDGADTTIEFCLAQVDPSGNLTNGINRVQRTTANYNSAAVEALKAQTIWDPTRYLNMWTFRFGGDLNGVLGYAQFPSGSGLPGMPSANCITGEETTDGVVAAFSTFGSRTIFPGGSYSGNTYDKGRTMTHEVGHMLGLRHIWGDGGCNVDDFCADTPNTGAANGGCPIGIDSCPADPGNDMIENYMDYTDDSCMNIFTQDQKDRMLAVLMNSPRRDDLLISTACQPSTQPPYIQFKRVACEVRLPSSYAETTNCNFTDVTIPLSISKAPSTNTVVTFSVSGTSTASINDIEFVTPTVIFNSGSTADQNLVLRIYNDGYVEGNEELIVTFTVNNNGGNALKNPNVDDVFQVRIIDNDVTITPVMINTLFTDDFSDADASNWTILDANGDTADDWTLVNESNWSPAFGIYTNYFMASYSWNGVAYSPNNYLSTPLINIPAGSTNLNLSYFAGSGSDPGFFSENYEVWISSSIGSQVNITAGTRLVDTVIPAVGGATYNVPIPNSFAGQNVYISFRHHDTTDEWLLGIDNVVVTAQQTVSIQTATNVATAGQNRLKGSGAAFYRDATNGNIMARVTVNDSSNYACTSTSVTRAGTSAAQYGTSTNVIDFATSKQFTITPANVVSGNATITFYFTEAEIAGWEAATGNNRSLLHVVRDGSTREIQPVTIGSFGAGVALTATFTAGIQGVYSFARQQSLTTDSFELNEIGIYPNPNNGAFNVQFTPYSEKVNVTVFDLRGRVIYDKQFSNSGLFDETIQLNNVESGMYLVKIQDGSRKITKRIIVQ
jgi:hypothetical protein